MDQWIALLQTFGLAVVCLFSLSLAVYRIGVWLANKVVLPIAERHLSLINTVEQTVQSQGRLLRVIIKRLQRMDANIGEVKSVVVRTSGPVSIQPQPPGSPSDPASPGR